ncbi:DNA-binding transcriptional regulator, ArsR family [Monaibacterium marinum]|uniref:DNA-binding transcriptional regulator, ArsR family n=1 Tax=Pontivivens marinum TaxID=1690039 RepID=A0A2C9CMQ0_9RHOB|nr:helix-turn-helix transcriptional regulator [Monaibacterium marinum]SOH92502.1 DNA-binding transcriptional regulator, ArsR family [Monaibacterium marinum]
MADGPDIARIATLIGDPARARMLTALMAGHALTASELAVEAGITRQTASGHIARLREGGLVSTARQGRHHYIRLSGSDVAETLEALMEIVDRRGPTRTRPGPKEPEMRHARICYDHLAGALGVQLHDRLIEIGHLTADLTPTPPGLTAFDALGIDIPALQRARRPLCRACLDWSERRTHLAGGLGAALFTAFEDRAWIRRVSGTRIVEIRNPAALYEWLL